MHNPSEGNVPAPQTPRRGWFQSYKQEQGKVTRTGTFVGNATTFRDLGCFLQEHRRGRTLNDVIKRTVGIHVDNDTDRHAVQIRGRRVELLHELPDVDPVLTQRGTDGRGGRRLSARCLEFDNRRYFFFYLAHGANRFFYSVLERRRRGSARTRLFNLFQLPVSHFDGRHAAKDRNDHADHSTLLIDGLDLALVTLKRTVGNLHLVADFYLQPG